jgi:glycosyltransferase involved in cell wall biosynthesis
VNSANGLKKLIAISPEAILPARHGGSLRSAYLITELAKHFDVRALLPQTQKSIEAALLESPWLNGPDWIGVPGHPAYKIDSLGDKIRMRHWNWCERREREKWSDLPWDWFIGSHHSWKIILKSMAKSFQPDFFLVEHGRNAAIARYAKKLWPKIQCIANLHNVESSLLDQTLPNNKDKRSVIREVELYERRILNEFDLLWTCSQADFDKYSQLGIRDKALRVVPNGVDTFKQSFISAIPNQETIIFVGNLGYKPNIDGVLWFYREVWPILKEHFPRLEWQLVGSWPGREILEIAKGDIRVAANAPSVRPYLEMAAVSICPLLSGSGTRLKILEAFSSGVPMVSTSIGAEGLEVEDGVHLYIRNSAEGFADAISKLLGNSVESENMRLRARHLAEQKYDWRGIAKIAAKELFNLDAWENISKKN